MTTMAPEPRVSTGEVSEVKTDLSPEMASRFTPEQLAALEAAKAAAEKKAARKPAKPTVPPDKRDLARNLTTMVRDYFQEALKALQEDNMDKYRVALRGLKVAADDAIALSEKF